MGAVLPPAARRERAAQFWAHAVSGSGAPAVCEVLPARAASEGGAGMTMRVDRLLAVTARQERVLLAEAGVVDVESVARIRVHMDKDAMLDLIAANASEVK